MPEGGTAKVYSEFNLAVLTQLEFTVNLKRVLIF
jgi:hypothetical protein